MSKSKPSGKEQKRSSAEYYKLHTQAVEDLVTADRENSPVVSEEELRQYRTGLRKYKISDWIKVLLVKFWFPAAVCYYMVWGLSTYVADSLDMLFITGIALGVITDILTNNLLRWFANREGENDRWMMFPQKKYYTFVLNILYAWVILYFVNTIYSIINVILLSINGADTVPLGVGPVLFGIFYLAVDTLLVEAKHLLGRIVHDAMERNR